MKVVEMFSGIGSQVKALEKLNKPFEIANISEWDINSIIAYDIIHNGKQILPKKRDYNKNDLIAKLWDLNLSHNGKEPISWRAINNMSYDTLRRLLYAHERTRNLANIEDVRGKDLPKDFDILTYSFPCQDLSNMGAIHGYVNGIDKNQKTRSGMLWQVERILTERDKEGLRQPRFLLLENVPSLNSSKHRVNFEKWQQELKKIGYMNEYFTLNARQFGIPQNRSRLIMVSVYINDLDDQHKSELHQLLKGLKSDLEGTQLISGKFKKYLRTNYSISKYLQEAIECTPNDTPSRRDIWNQNPTLLSKDQKFADATPTITTKQDRHPNSGNIYFELAKDLNAIKSSYRYLTPRECFLLMGFEEKDIDRLIKHNFKSNSSKMFFTRDKFYKMAGNSIVVNVLEAVFAKIYDLDEIIKTKFKI